MAAPLIGDTHRRYRVFITGNSGSGKSTLGRALAARLGVPYISLDTLFWQPDWKQTPIDEFRDKVSAALQIPTGWVVDGSYRRRLGDIVEREATDVIWLDPPLVLYFPRLFLRTFLRLLGRGSPCSPGCFETIRSAFFSKDSVLWWCLSHHWECRKQGWAMMREIGLHAEVGTCSSEKCKMRRIGGWGGELHRWWKDVEEMIHNQN